MTVIADLRVCLIRGRRSNMKEIKSVKESYDDYKSRINSRSYQMTDVEKRNLFYAYILDKKKMNKVILLQSNSGYSAEGSVRSIYNFMRKQDKWKNYKFVWVVKNKIGRAHV